MGKFKIGDVVRIVRDEHRDGGYYGLYDGHVGKIVALRDEIRGYHPGYQYGVELSGSGVEGYGVAERNLELVTESKQGEKVMRKTYKLLKDMPGYKKGTLFQEQCEDGTQPYSVYGDQHGTYDDYDVKLEFTNRSYVENNPKWFVEVFQVSPQYMTREELDQFEAFKKREKSPTAKRKYAKRNTRP